MEVDPTYTLGVSTERGHLFEAAPCPELDSLVDTVDQLQGMILSISNLI